MERDFTHSLRRKLYIALIVMWASERWDTAMPRSLPGQQRRMQKDGAGGQGQVSAKIAVTRRLVQVFLERAANLFPVSSWAPEPKSLKILASFMIAVWLLIAHPSLLLKSCCWDSAALIWEPTFSACDMARPFKCYHGQQQLWCSCAELLKIEYLSPPFPCSNAERVQPPHPPCTPSIFLLEHPASMTSSAGLSGGSGLLATSQSHGNVLSKHLSISLLEAFLGAASLGPSLLAQGC